MNDYKYHLAKWTERNKSVRCPNCGKGKGSYKEYVDDNGNPVDPDGHLCGKCDHESSCGYHVTPSEWQKEHGQIQTSNHIKKEVRTPDCLYIDNDTVALTVKPKFYTQNNLVCWLRSLPWSDEQRHTLEHALQTYVVGTLSNRGTIFWQLDGEQRVRTGKKMLYGLNGKRLKDAQGNSIGFGFMHNVVPDAVAKIKAGTHMFVQCAFGLHVTKIFPTAEVHIVESEKTALLMTCYDQKPWQEHVWIAVGSMQQLSEQWLYGLKGRVLVAYPDANAVEDWTRRVNTLKQSGYNINISTGWMKFYDVERDPKADIGDLVIQRLTATPEARLQMMAQENPNIHTLINKFNLTLDDGKGNSNQDK